MDETEFLKQHFGTKDEIILAVWADWIEENSDYAEEFRFLLRRGRRPFYYAQDTAYDEHKWEWYCGVLELAPSNLHREEFIRLKGGIMYSRLARWYETCRDAVLDAAQAYGFRRK